MPRVPFEGGIKSNDVSGWGCMESIIFLYCTTTHTQTTTAWLLFMQTKWWFKDWRLNWRWLKWTIPLNANRMGISGKYQRTTENAPHPSLFSMESQLTCTVSLFTKNTKSQKILKSKWLRNFQDGGIWIATGVRYDSQWAESQGWRLANDLQLKLSDSSLPCCQSFQTSKDTLEECHWVPLMPQELAKSI